MRPSNVEWNPSAEGNKFVFVSNSISEAERVSLLFVKFFDVRSRQMKFCGTIDFLDDEIFFSRFQHLRHLCDVKDGTQLKLLDIHSRGYCSEVDVTKSFQEQGLKMGSIIVAQEGTPSKPIVRELRADLTLSSYSTHRSPLSINPSTVVQKLFCQAMDNLFTDVVFISGQPLSDEKYCLRAHKNVLATVDHFKIAFESGMKESEASVAEFEVPPNATKLTMVRFLSFLYNRDPSPLLLNYTIGSLSELLRVADYYGFEELIEKASAAIEKKYSWLSEHNALELLRTIDSLHFPRKGCVERLAIEYIVCNFSRVSRMQGFQELFGKNIYYSIVDAVSRASWDKRNRNYE